MFNSYVSVPDGIWKKHEKQWNKLRETMWENYMGKSRVMRDSRRVDKGDQDSWRTRTGRVRKIDWKRWNMLGKVTMRKYGIEDCNDSLTWNVEPWGNSAHQPSFTVTLQWHCIPRTLLAPLVFVVGFGKSERGPSDKLPQDRTSHPTVDLSWCIQDCIWYTHHESRWRWFQTDLHSHLGKPFLLLID